MYVINLSSRRLGSLAQFSPPPKLCGTNMMGFPSARTAAKPFATERAG